MSDESDRAIGEQLYSTHYRHKLQEVTLGCYNGHLDFDMEVYDEGGADWPMRLEALSLRPDEAESLGHILLGWAASVRKAEALAAGDRHAQG